MREFSLSRGFGLGRRKAFPAFGPVLGTLSLSNASASEDALPGTIVGTVLGYTPGATLGLAENAGGRFSLTGTDIVMGLTGLDYETATSHQITLRETLAEANNSPRDTILTITVADVAEVALSALSLSNAQIAEDAPPGIVVGNLTGVTNGSALILTDDAAGRLALAGTQIVTGLTELDYETATAHDITVRETLAGALNSPRYTTLTITVNDVAEAPPAIFSIVDLTGDTLTVETDRDCDVAYMVLPSTDTDPSATTIYGTGSSFSVTSTSGEVLDIDAGLDPGDYVVHLVTHDGGGNFGAVSRTATFTVADPNSPAAFVSNSQVLDQAILADQSYNAGILPANTYVLAVAHRTGGFVDLPSTITGGGVTLVRQGTGYTNGFSTVSFYVGTFASEFTGDFTAFSNPPRYWATGLFSVGGRSVVDQQVGGSGNINNVPLTAALLAGDTVIAVAAAKNANPTWDAPMTTVGSFTPGSVCAGWGLFEATADGSAILTARNSSSFNDLAAAVLVLR